jgi:hypothetical protein
LPASGAAAASTAATTITTAVSTAVDPALNQEIQDQTRHTLPIRSRILLFPKMAFHLRINQLVTPRKANQHKMTNANNANKGELVNDNMRRMIVFPPVLPTVADDEGGIRPMLPRICRCVCWGIPEAVVINEDRHHNESGECSDTKSHTRAKEFYKAAQRVAMIRRW